MEQRRWRGVASRIGGWLTVILAATLLLSAVFGAQGQAAPVRGHRSRSTPMPTSTPVLDGAAGATVGSAQLSPVIASSPDSSPPGAGADSLPATVLPAAGGSDVGSAAPVGEGTTALTVRPHGTPARLPAIGRLAASQASPATGPAAQTETPGARVWPLAPGTYDFSQPFGCVPQLGFYAVAPGCPPDRPAFHTGIDLAAPLGTVFYAAASGTVQFVGLDRPTAPANSWLLIAHEGPNAGFETEYFHWTTAYVQVGQHVAAGEAIGEVGSVGFSTGPHLHFGVIDEAGGSRIDPIGWLPADASGGAYLGVAPGAVVTTFDNVSAGVPDFADPSPPPVPTPAPPPDVPPTAPPDVSPTAIPTAAGEPTTTPAAAPTETPAAAPTETPAPPATEPPPTEPPATEPPPTDTPAPEPTEPPAPEPTATQRPHR